MSEHTSAAASVCRSHEHSAQSDSADKQESEKMMQEQATRFTIAQHVHMSEIPVIVVAIDDIADPTQRVYIVKDHDGHEQTASDSQLSS